MVITIRVECEAHDGRSVLCESVQLTSEQVDLARVDIVGAALTKLRKNVEHQRKLELLKRKGQI